MKLRIYDKLSNSATEILVPFLPKQPSLNLSLLSCRLLLFRFIFWLTRQMVFQPYTNIIYYSSPSKQLVPNPQKSDQMFTVNRTISLMLLTEVVVSRKCRWLIQFWRSHLKHLNNYISIINSSKVSYFAANVAAAAHPSAAAMSNQV